MESVTIDRRLFLLAAAVSAVSTAFPSLAQQQADKSYKPKVDAPVFQGSGKVVVIDEGHNNFHTATGRYEPFANLLRADGLIVKPGVVKFDENALTGIDALVIANALPPRDRSSDTAFTLEECAALEAWVRSGGALWLVADHAPFGAATQNLANVFGFQMGDGWVYEPTSGGLTTQIEFDRKSGALGNHPITNGLNAKEAIKKVKSFSGQSLTLPPGGVALLSLGAGAREARSNKDLSDAEMAFKKRQAPMDAAVAGRVQGFALEHGAGRLVVLGEAAMITAQRVNFGNGQSQTVGMGSRSIDNEQFALNINRWLLRAL
jgi:hypothetical protein